MKNTKMMWKGGLVMFMVVFSVYIFSGSSVVAYEKVDGASQIAVDDLQDSQVAFSTSTQGENHHCFADFESWPKSTKFKNVSGWNPTFMVPKSSGRSSAPIEQFVDINGDGLPDYFYSYHMKHHSHKNTHMVSCVYLNNGNGWDPAYRCLTRQDKYKNDGKFMYFGDCADTSAELS